MSKSLVGIYRTVFPLYSETFISEQMRAYVQFEPMVLCRELVRDVDNFQFATIDKPFRVLKKIGFTAFGITGVFSNVSALKQVNLVHAHFTPDAILALPLSKKLNVPLFVTCHGSDVMVSDRHLLMSGKLSAIRYLLGRERLKKSAAKFIAVSKFLRDAMIQRGFPAEKVVVHYIGVDTTKFYPPKDTLAKVMDGDFILSIARHTEVKGLDVLLKAFAKVVNAHPTLRLVQIGSGGLTQELKKLATQLGIRNNVDFLGVQSPTEILPYLQSCATLVLSSRKAKNGAEEALGLVLLEAAACGVPCIGTNVGGIPEVVVDGETGFIVESENIQALSEKMQMLLTDRALAKKMGGRGRVMVCEKFDINTQAKKLEGMYSEILELRGVCRS